MMATPKPDVLSSAYPAFSENNFHNLCDSLTSRDLDLKFIIDTYGYPPMWTRPNTFETLVHIILEQQVSLASALAALNKLQERLKTVTPEGVLSLSDEELRACYFSRQKTGYVRYLANAMIQKEVDLQGLPNLPDDGVRAALHILKGVGNWTIDIYLIFVLRRLDVFPTGDLAAVNALKQLRKLPVTTTRDEVLELSNVWAPQRTIATMILWHYYLSIRKKA